MESATNQSRLTRRSFLKKAGAITSVAAISPFTISSFLIDIAAATPAPCPMIGGSSLLVEVWLDYHALMNWTKLDTM